MQWKKTNNGEVLSDMENNLRKSALFKPGLTSVVNERKGNFQRFEIYIELDKPINR